MINALEQKNWKSEIVTSPFLIFMHQIVLYYLTNDNLGSKKIW
jgi:hypothetical protein